jgi:SulP family sulfate permease
VIGRAAAKAHRRKTRVDLTGTSPGVRRELFKHGARPPFVEYDTDIDRAYAKFKGRNGSTTAATAATAATS